MRTYGDSLDSAFYDGRLFDEVRGAIQKAVAPAIEGAVASRDVKRGGIVARSITAALSLDLTRIALASGYTIEQFRALSNALCDDYANFVAQRSDVGLA